MSDINAIKNMLNINSWLLGVVGSLLFALISLVVWVYLKHEKANDRNFEKNSEDHEKIRVEIDSEVKRIYDKIEKSGDENVQAHVRIHARIDELKK